MRVPNRPTYWGVSILAALWVGCSADGVLPSAPKLDTGPQAGSAAPSTYDACCYGPVTFVRSKAKAPSDSVKLVGDPTADYVIDINDNASQGADGIVVLDGATLMNKRSLGETGPRHIVLDVKVTAQSLLTVRLSGKSGSTLTIEIRRWTSVAPLTGNRVNNVFSLSASNVYIGADGGELFTSTDGGANFSSFPPGMSTPTYQVSGTAVDNLYVVSWYGTMKHWDGTSWTDVGPGGYSSNNALYRVWGSSANDVYGVGDDGMVWHFNGTTWAAVDVAPVALQVGAFQGVWGSSATDVFIGGGPVGRAGRDPAAIYHFDGSSWQSMPLPATVSSLNIGNIWGTGHNDVYAVAYDYNGTAGALLHYDGSAWSVVFSAPVGLIAVGGFGTDTRYVVGFGGAMYVKSGSSWNPVNTGTSATLMTIYFTQDGTGWVGGEGGVLLKKQP